MNNARCSHKQKATNIFLLNSNFFEKEFKKK